MGALESKSLDESDEDTEDLYQEEGDNDNFKRNISTKKEANKKGAIVGVVTSSNGKSTQTLNKKDLQNDTDL